MPFYSATLAFAKLHAHIVKCPDTGCWLWQGPRNKRGYGRICWQALLMRTNETLVHRIMWVLNRNRFVPKNKVISHKCNTPACCNPKHLLMTTQQKNVAYRDACGRQGNHKGENHGRALVTATDVKYIRATYIAGKPGPNGKDSSNVAVLAKKFNVSSATIGDIVRKRTWAHVK